jgi:spore germination cell wall hydrolase CwlJ-like protein
LSGGNFALAVQDTIVLKIGTQASAEWRVLLSAALIGSGVGMALGAAYMVGGMAQAATDHSRAARIAEAASGGFSESVLQREVAAMDPGTLRLAREHDPFTSAGAAERDRQAAIIATRLERRADTRGATTSYGQQPGTALDSSRDLDCLTSAVYFEARGETPRGQAAVAQVVLNRVKNPSFPKTVCGVVFQGAARHTGCQFSFACDGSMHSRRESDAWDRARKVAARALSGAVLADIGSATHFHTTGVAPVWGPRMLRVAQVGLHVFYRFNPHASDRGLTTERAVFASLPTPPAPTEFRLASALVDKVSDAAAPAAASAAPAPAAQPALAATAEAKPQVKVLDVPAAGLTKASDQAATAKSVATSAS